MYTIRHAEIQIEEAYKLLHKTNRDGVYRGVNIITIITNWENYILTKLNLKGIKK